MADEKTPFELVQAKKQEVWERISPQILAHLNASAGYGQLAVRSAMLLNGGALFAFPAFISSTGKLAIISDTLVLLSGGSFIAGIVFAAICSYLAYLNFQFNVFSLDWQRLKEFSEIEEGYDYTSKHRMKKDRAEYRNELDAGITKFEKRVWWTMLIGNISGILSYLTFIIGCFLAGVALS